MVLKLVIVIAILHVTIVRGWEDFDVNSTIMKELIQKNLEKYSENYYEGTQVLKILNIDSAEFQFIGVTMYRIHAEVGETDCPKGHDSDKCKLMKSARIIHCNFELFEVPWRNFKSHTINCH